MRILFVAPYVPSRLRVRPYQLIRHLGRLGHRVTVLAARSSAREEAEAAELAAECARVETVLVPRRRSLWNSARGLRGRLPLQAIYSHSPALERLVRRELGRGETDLLHVEHLRSVALSLDFEDVPRIFDSVDCISALFAQTLRHSVSRRSRAMARLELEKTRRFEGWLVHQFDGVLATSAADAAALRALAAESTAAAAADKAGSFEDAIAVLPNGVDLEYFRPRPEPRQPATLLYVGRMSYHANVTAALSLLREIMPRIWARRPDVRLLIAGDAPARRLRAAAARCGERVTLTGYLADLRPILATATISVSPLVYGAGIQNKILEAMAMETPVITTARGAEALAARPGEDLIVAADPADFAEATLHLLDDGELRSQLGGAGRRYVESHHDWRDICRRLEGHYTEAVDRHRRRRATASAPTPAAAPISLPARPAGSIAKEILDRGSALLGILLLLPILALIAAAVRISSPGPIIHRRRVLGIGGVEFDAFKFRTMVADADERLSADAALAAAYSTNIKIRNDPRVTPLGGLLRSLSLDELPQLVNVARGQMSLVGPRMISPVEAPRYGTALEKRLTVKPGITGLWQVSGRQEVGYQRRIELDLEYIDNWSLWLDLVILLKTIPAVLSMRGAF